MHTGATRTSLEGSRWKNIPPARSKILNRISEAKCQYDAHIIGGAGFRRNESHLDDNIVSCYAKINRARSRLSISYGVMNLILSPIQTLGILIFLREAAAIS